MGLSLYVVDAFTDQPFAGNPAAVTILNEPLSDLARQVVARELNLSETAFLEPLGQDASAGWRLRWFTPAAEVDLCGHATLASAFVLWHTGQLPAMATARFSTRSGWLTVQRCEPTAPTNPTDNPTAAIGSMEMDFPAKPVQPCTAPAGLQEALACPFLFVGQNQMDYLVEVADEATVRQLQPDYTRLQQLPLRGVIVTARADSEQADKYDFVSRFFAPAIGVPEDPVTGSAHCALAPFWAQRWQRPTLTGYQASARGGIVQVHCQADRVLLRGQAVLIWTGELLTLPTDNLAR